MGALPRVASAGVAGENLRVLVRRRFLLAQTRTYVIHAMYQKPEYSVQISTNLPQIERIRLISYFSKHSFHQIHCNVNTEYPVLSKSSRRFPSNPIRAINRRSCHFLDMYYE